MTGDFRYCEACELCYHEKDCERDYQGRSLVFSCPVCACVTTKVGVEGDDMAIFDYLVTL